MTLTGVAHELLGRLPALAQAASGRWDAAKPVLGALVLLAALRLLAWLVRFVWVFFLRPAIDPRSYGEWAVVTGATDGIGRAYSRLLAQRGLNILLVSRDAARLKACAAELEAQHGVATRTCAVDLCTAGPAEFGGIGAAMEGLEVGILVNNAGQYFDLPCRLEDLSPQFLVGHVGINALAPTLLCKMALPGMKARRRGLIVNIGSGVASAMLQAPYLQAYGATKTYLDALSRGLDLECSGHGVRVQNQWPMWVHTKMAKTPHASLLVPTPDIWAAAALRQIGRETCCTPYWFHALLHALLGLAPGTGQRNNLSLTLAWRERELAARTTAAKAPGDAAGKWGVAGAAARRRK